MPPDPAAIYRPIPASASLAAHITRLPAHWNDIHRNPLLAIALNKAGLSPYDAHALTTNPVSQNWFRKLAGNECLLAASPQGISGVSWLAGRAQRLRWQLELFPPKSFARIAHTPGHTPVWRVENFAPPGNPNLLHIAFVHGTLLASLSTNTTLIFQMLDADNGHCARLLDASDSYRRFAANRNPLSPIRLWASRRLAGADTTASLLPSPLSLHLDLITSAAPPLNDFPTNRPPTPSPNWLASLLATSPALAASFQAESLPWLLHHIPSLHPSLQHALRMAHCLAQDRLALFLLDGPLSGHLSASGMPSLGLRLKVPTLLLATPAPSPHAPIAHVLASCNSRYHSAFLFREITENNHTCFVLSSRNGNEWVDALSLPDRPAYTITNHCLLFASNLAALRTLLATTPDPNAPTPPWADVLSAEGAAALWLHSPRTDRILRDTIGLWRLARRLMGQPPPKNESLLLETATMWSARLLPFQTLTAGVGANANHEGLWASLNLGLPPPSPLH